MNNDVRKNIYGALIVLLLVVFAWLSFLFVNACGFALTCKRGAFPVERTSIPTLIPATLPAMDNTSSEAAAPAHCRVAGVDLIGAWVEADSSETQAFQFVDADGQNCETTFEEVKPLFIESNLWYAGSLSCISCHSVDVAVSPAQLDLSSYAGIIAGSRRADAESNGTDILGAGNWDSSLLYKFVLATHADVPGHTEIKTDLIIFAGRPVPLPPPTATPLPAADVTVTSTP